MNIGRSGNNILKHMQSIFARRPITIAVQAIDACNSACVFCARRKIKPTRTTMSLELFEKVCKDYSSIGGGHLDFSPLIVDALVDPLFISRIKIITKYRNVTPNIFTNGIAFINYSDDELVKLLDAVHHIDISIGGFDRASYKTMYGVDKFEVVWNQLMRLNSLNSGKKH
jgi:MoaA/NifB/PqqE/SkfB family radical SAM enzyme